MMRFGSQLQTNWDWRAACNFMFGGTGGALLVVLALFGMQGTASGAAVAIALVFVGFGLFMVWLEIGRPWRFLHVFFHPQTSWMSREASVGMVLFPVAIAGVWLDSSSMFTLAALLGLVFLYCQARILKAARGVPAWRAPAIVPLIVTTGFAEGLGAALIYAAITGLPTVEILLALLLALIARAWAWYAYRDALHRAQAPPGTLSVLQTLHVQLVLYGVVLPAVAAFIALKGVFAIPTAIIAGLATLLSGWGLKYVLVVKASFKQGYGIGKLRSGRPKPKPPVRRDGDPIQY